MYERAHTHTHTHTQQTPIHIYAGAHRAQSSPEWDILLTGHNHDGWGGQRGQIAYPDMKVEKVNKKSLWFSLWLFIASVSLSFYTHTHTHTHTQ